MDIGKPSREYVVEPVEDPVPRDEPAPEPESDAAEPEPVPKPNE